MIADGSDPSAAARRAREEREDRALADAIERAWQSRFGRPTVIAEVELARIRRGGR